MQIETTRAAHMMAFTAEGQLAGYFTSRDRKDWQRDNREARERAGKGGTIFLYAASVNALTGKLIGVSATPALHRGTPSARED